MRVNHRGRIARLLCRQIFVGVQREVKRAKTVSQPVSFAGDFRRFAEFAKMFLKCCLFPRPKFSCFVSAVRFKPNL